MTAASTDAGEAFQTYSPYGRGVEVTMGTYNNKRHAQAALNRLNFRFGSGNSASTLAASGCSRCVVPE